MLPKCGSKKFRIPTEGWIDFDTSPTSTLVPQTVGERGSSPPPPLGGSPRRAVRATLDTRRALSAGVAQDFYGNKHTFIMIKDSGSYDMPCVCNEAPLGLVMIIMICFSCLVQMAEGLHFGVVPYVSRPALGVVSGMVGAGGNFALAAARALYEGKKSSEEIAIKAINIASEICVFTNNKVRHLTLTST